MAKHAISQRRACPLASAEPKTVRRERVPDCPKIRERMREIDALIRLHGKPRVIVSGNGTELIGRAMLEW